MRRISGYARDYAGRFRFGLTASSCLKSWAEAGILFGRLTQGCAPKAGLDPGLL
jgi:hypothetical protein